MLTLQNPNIEQLFFTKIILKDSLSNNLEKLRVKFSNDIFSFF